MALSLTPIGSPKVFRRFASETGGIFQILRGKVGHSAIGPVAVCGGEAQLDLLYLASRGIAAVQSDSQTFEALPSDQLRVQHLWASMKLSGLKRLDVVMSGSWTEPLFSMRYRELDFDDIITVVRLMVVQPSINPCDQQKK